MNEQIKKRKTESKLDQNSNTFYSYLNANSNKIGWILSSLYFLILCIVSFSFHKIGDYGVESDFFGAYVPQALKLSEGIWVIDSYKGPLYQIVLFLTNSIINNYFISGMFIAILSASLVIFFVFSLLKSLFNPIVALVTTLLLAVNTTFNLYTYSAGTDMFFNFLITAALYFLLAMKNYDWKNFLIAGLFSGLAYITRYNGVFVLISALTVILLFNIYQVKWIKRIIASGIFLIVFVAIITPWGIYTQKEKGKAFWNQNYQNVAYEYLAKDKMGWDEFWYQGNRDKYTSLSQVILKEPGAFFKQYVNNGFDHLGKDLNNLTGWQISVFSILGLLLFFSKPPTRRQWAFYLANVLFFGVIMLVFYSERFSLFLIPFYVVIGVNALFTENKYLKNTISKSPALTFIIALILVIWTFSNSYSYNSENINSGDKNLLKLQVEFNKVEPKAVRGDKIMARKAHVAYYLGLEMTWVPSSTDYYTQITEIWKKQVDYVSYGIWEMGRSLSWLQDPNKLPPDFKVLIYTSSKNKVISQKEDTKNTYKITASKQEQPALIYKVVMDSVRIRIIEAGDWMLKNAPFDQRLNNSDIAAVAPYIGAYVNRKFYELPNLEISELAKNLKQAGVTYLFFGTYELEMRPQLAALADPSQAPAGFKPIYSQVKGTNFPFVIYIVE